MIYRKSFKKGVTESILGMSFYKNTVSSRFDTIVDEEGFITHNLQNHRTMYPVGFRVINYYLNVSNLRTFYKMSILDRITCVRDVSYLHNPVWMYPASGAFDQALATLELVLTTVKESNSDTYDYLSKRNSICSTMIRKLFAFKYAEFQDNILPRMEMSSSAFDLLSYYDLAQKDFTQPEQIITFRRNVKKFNPAFVPHLQEFIHHCNCVHQILQVKLRETVQCYPEHYVKSSLTDDPEVEGTLKREYSEKQAEARDTVDKLVLAFNTIQALQCLSLITLGIVQGQATKTA